VPELDDPKDLFGGLTHQIADRPLQSPVTWSSVAADRPRAVDIRRAADSRLGS